MSTAPTKVVKTVKGLNAWTKTWWTRVPEPRDLSLVFSVAYVVSLLGGIVAFVAPPQSLTGIVGPTLLAIIGVFLIAGSLMAMFAGAKEIWLVERLGIWLMGGGVFTYGLQVGIIQATQPGARWLQMAIIVIALLLFIVRYRLIRIYTYRPRG